MNNANASKLKNTIIIISFVIGALILGVALVVWPIWTMLDMLNSLNDQAEYVSFDKGAYYLFGGGICFLTFSLGTIFGYIFRNLNKQQLEIFKKTFYTLIVIGLVTIFTLPHAVEYYVDDLLIKNGYSICEARSSQWLHAKTVVYSLKKPCE